MVSPINYGTFFQGQASPNDAFQQAFQQASGIREMMDKREAAVRQAQAQAAMQQELADVANNPNATAADYSRLMTKYPALSENLKRSWDTLSADQQRTSLGSLSKVTAAFASNKPEVAVQILRDQAEGLRNAGDEQGAKRIDDIARMTEIDPAVGRSVAYSMVAAVPGGDKIIEGLGKVGAEARAQAMAPAELRKAEAQATGAEAEAVTKGVTAKFAESNALQEIEQRGWNIKNLQADIDYKKAQSRIAAMNAAIAREGNDLKRQELRMKIDDAVRERESKLRDKIGAAEGAAASIDNLLNTIERVKVNRSLNDVIGSIEGRIPAVFSDEAADAIAMIETLGSQTFLSQIPAMKGTGSLTEKEGDKLQSSLTNLSRVQSEAQFRANLDEAARLMKKARERISQSTGVPLSSPDTPAAPGARPPLSSFERAQ